MASKPFVGFGDPVIGKPKPDAQASGMGADGGLDRMDAIRALARLPETADELKAIAKALGAKNRDIHLAEAATERRVKSTDLAPYRTVAFATHGLMATELPWLVEPALVFTPPETATDEDNGLLEASEIAQLNFNADWVILSACNTAAADGTPGGEGLSGLAKAFFYAGSRALVVSHWAVDSEATVALTTGTFKALEAEPRIGRAEALRRAMLALMNDPERPEYADPYYWAPFMVVGEGAGEADKLALSARNP